MEIAMSECVHGITLVNGMGCVICSNKGVQNKVCVKVTKESRETHANRVLLSLLGDKVDEVSHLSFL